MIRKAITHQIDILEKDKKSELESEIQRFQSVRDFYRIGLKRSLMLDKKK